MIFFYNTIKIEWLSMNRCCVIVNAREFFVSLTVPRRKEVWNFHKIINLKYQLFEFPSSVYPTLPYFGCHRLWDIITIQLIMRGNLFENSWFPGSRVEIREKWIETGVEGMHDFIITGGSFRSRAWRVVFLPPPPEFSRECTGVFPVLESKLVFSSADAFLHLATVFTPGF